MVNKLLHEAEKWTKRAVKNPGHVTWEDIEKAKNAISSAYANTTMAEQEILQEYQKELDQLEEQLE